MSERAILMRLAEPADTVEPDWQDALRRAGYLGRHIPRRRELVRPRRVLVLVAAALILIYAVAAVAAGRPRVGPAHWLFDRSDETYPVRQVPELGEWVLRKRSGVEFVQSKKELTCIAELRPIDLGPRSDVCIDRVPAITAIPVLRGSVAGHRFEISTWFSDPDLNLGFDAGEPADPYYGTNVPAPGDGWGAVGIRGLREPVDGEILHWVSITATYTGEGPITKDGVGRGPKWFFGAANPKVARVDLVNTNDGTVVTVPTIPPPKGLPVRVRFWVAALRLDQLVHIVVPRDHEGDELERWRLEMAL